MSESTKKLSSVSFFCPAYHDEKNLPVLIPKVHNLLSRIAEKFEIIIVEDGSPDKTGEVADDLAQRFSNTRAVHHEKNRGYGGALKTGFTESKYDYVMYTDGDHQYDVYEFEPYFYLLENADIISGYVKKKAVSNSRKFQSFFFNFLIGVMFFTRVNDINCSMKIYKRKVLDSIVIKSDSAFIDAEMILRSKKKGFKVRHFPVTHYEREEGLASGSNPSVIINTIKDMIKYRLGIL